MLYYAQIYSHLYSNTQLNTMQKLQNQAIRLVDSNQPNIETSYKTLGILKLNEAIKMENCKMMHKLEHNRLPGKLSLLFKTDNKGKSLQKTHKYNTRTKNIPKLPKTQTKLYKNSFLSKCINDYQTIPRELREITNSKLFIKKYKNITLS